MGSTGNGDSILRVENLHTYFHDGQSFVQAVNGVSFHIRHGGRFGLAGESGSGKTQTALAIAGLVRGTPGVIQGDIWINGENVLRNLDRYCTVEDGETIRVRKDVREWRRERERRMQSVRGRVVSMVFQEPKRSLSPYYTVGEQAYDIVAQHFGADAAAQYEDRVRPLLRNMGFHPPRQILSRYPHELSGGQSQRVMLALALLSEPSLLIADEPTTLLDAMTEQRVLELLDALIRERNVALLLITHDLGVLAQYVDEMAIMKNGTVVEDGEVPAILGGSLQERHPYTQRLRRAAERSGMLIARKEST